MKRLGLLALLLTNASAYAVNPVQGWYGGMLLGFNYTPSTNFTFPTTFVPPPEVIGLIPAIPTHVDITLNYKTMGQIAGEVGYRCGNYRVEGQLGYNNSPYSSLKLEGSGGKSITLFAPSTSQHYTFEGSTDTISGMINGYYDFIPTEPDANLAPFVGLGLGYAYTQNVINMNFWYNSTEIREARISRTTTSPAGQVMIGASYFLDDFTAFSLDLRYFTTQKKSEVLQARVQVASVNLTFNGAFNLG